MSTDKEEIALYYEAKNDKVRKRLGIKGGFYWRTAKKLSVAISRGVVAMDDAGFDEEDFKKTVRVNLPIVNDLPPEGVFDTEFCNRYEKGGEDGITMIFIAPSPSVQDKPASSDNTNVNGEDMAEIEDNMLLPISGQELPIRWLAQHGSEKPVTHVSREELQALHIARAEELPAVTALAISHNTKLLDPLEIRDLHKLVRDTDKVFPNPVNSSLGLMTAFFEAYLDADYTDRGLLTKEWMKGNRVLRISRTPSGAMADEQATTEAVEPDTTEHNQDTQSMDAQPQINSVDAKYQKLRAELHEARKNIPPKNPVDADKLLAASHGEFVEGISDPNDPKWVKGIETRDSVNQNQHESEQNDQKAEQNSPNALQNEPETKLPEPEVQQEPEKVCTACGQTGDGNCPDCGAVMGDATYQETFDEKNQAEVQEDDSEEMESAVYPNKECTEGDQHANGNNETGETANPLIKVNGHHESTSTSRLWHHLMIDLETMGKNPDAPINALAGKFFDPATGEMGPEFSKTIDLETAGGVIDRDTIKWWLKQSREAQSAILTDEIPLDDALLQLREFIDENSGEFFVQVWGNGANFDNVILRRSYERQGIPCPWRYTNDRDVRTMVALGLVMDFDARSVITFEGERHNALHDARYQAKYVSAIWQKLIPSQADF
ncbi:3'-5' exoribonuclease [Escherichia coli]|nr:3'-5' exoribonuclease [Escherichia coli]ELJ1136166.1 3'-5' exoribonuclease [Escherichia coli]